MESSKKKFGWEQCAKVGIALFYIVYGAACMLTFYRQSVGHNGGWPSDLPAHIVSGLNGTGYSLMEVMLAGLVRLFDNYRPTGVFLGLVTLATIYLTWKLLVQLAPRVNATMLHIAAIACNLVTAIYIPALNPYRYLGVQSGNIYHNSTYTGMKFFGLLVLYLYFAYNERYEKGLTKKEWIAFSVSLILVNLMKPNFFVAFAPAMGIYLLIDLIRKKGKTFPQIFMFGLAVIPSVAVLLVEYLLLFTGSSGEGEGLMIAVGYSLSLRTNYPLAAVVQTMAFPLWILLFNLKDLKRERAYGFTWLFLLIAFLEYFVLCETGTRKDHGNLSWGYCFAIFAVFVVSAAKVFANFRDKTHPKPRWYYGVAGALLLLHLFFGSWYFSIIFRGGEFF